MGTPVRRLKLLAFAIGAGVAGLGGSIFAAWQTAVFPANFDVTLLITLYAMVVLGGVGSQAGAIAGAFLLGGAASTLAVVLELLLVLAGLDLVVTGALGHCPLYAKLGHVPASLKGRTS